MNLCLDSNVLIEILRGRHSHFRQRLDEAANAGASLHLSPIVLHELVLGAQLSARPAHQMERVRELTRLLEHHAWTDEDAIETAGMRARLHTTGRPIGAYDMMIAGQCLARGWTLVTANHTEFNRVDGLGILDWSQPHV